MKSNLDKEQLKELLEKHKAKQEDVGGKDVHPSNIPPMPNPDRPLPPMCYAAPRPPSLPERDFDTTPPPVMCYAGPRWPLGRLFKRRRKDK